MEKKVIIVLIAGIVLIGCILLITNYKSDQTARLDICIEDAKISRNDLWDANCEEQEDGSCTIDNDSGTIEWIEQRYEQDLNACYRLYD